MCVCLCFCVCVFEWRLLEVVGLGEWRRCDLLGYENLEVEWKKSKLYEVSGLLFFLEASFSACDRWECVWLILQGGLQQVSWFQLLAEGEVLSSNFAKKERSQQDMAAMHVMRAHMWLQEAGNLSSWTVLGNGVSLLREAVINFFFPFFFGLETRIMLESTTCVETTFFLVAAVCRR